jgi:hypothetical protein
MSKRAVVIPIRTETDPQLHSVNRKISQLTAQKPWADIYAAFSLTAQLAALGIESVEELQQMPGASVGILQPVLDFWHRVRDSNYAAALACAGGNQTLAEALVAFRFLRNVGGEMPDAS